MRKRNSKTLNPSREHRGGRRKGGRTNKNGGAAACAMRQSQGYPHLQQRRWISSLKRISDNVKQKRNDVSLYRRLLCRKKLDSSPPQHPLPPDAISSSAFSIAPLLRHHCSSLRDGHHLHHRIILDGLDPHPFLGNLLVQMYGSRSSFPEAFDSFSRLPFHDEFAWNFLISSCVRHGHRIRALLLFEQMQIEGQIPNHHIFASIASACASSAIPEAGKRIHARVVDSVIEADISVGNALVNMYEKCGSLVSARKVFDRMPERDTLSWTAIIAAYGNRGYGKDTLQLFEGMIEKGIKPNEVTFVSILPACSKQAALTVGKRIHGFIADSGYEMNTAVGNALIDMYGKCGSLEAAKCMFDKMAAGRRDVVSWTTMIAVFAQHGQPRAALDLFDEMQQQNVTPDEVTFVSVLSACSHGGFVKEGCNWWLMMNDNYHVVPIVDHYNCMLDLLGRVGKLAEAEDMLNEMPLEPTFVSWMTLLGACKHIVDVGRGERAAQRAMNLDPQDPAPYVMLSSIYLSAGRPEDAAQILRIMKEKGLRKPPGISSVEVNGTVHEFRVDDSYHPQKDEIYATLRKLTSQMVLAGHDPKNISGDSLEEKEHSHSNHSEMIAIAFGILSTPPGATLVITKNLRACTDCHSAIKFISKLTSRKIVVRDAHRFHHVEGGLCSCGDYW